MNPISSDIVEKIWKATGGMSPEKGPEMIKHMSKQQPLILAYLMATGDDTLNQEERELLLYLGVVVWQIMSPEKGPEMIKRMSKQQPLILAYLMATGDDTLNQEERELLLYLGVVVWQIMSQGTTPLPKVTEKVLEEIEDSNMKMLEYLEGEPEDGFIVTVEKIINNYNQREVLRYVVEAIMEEPEDGSMIRDENTGIMMFVLKTVIDCFDK